MVGDIEDSRRTEPPFVLDERAMLEGWLEFHRTTLLFKCEGLEDGQRKARPVPTSLLSLHGLVRHMAEVERSWFRRALLDDPDAPDIWPGPAAEDAELAPLDDADWDADLRAWQDECEASRRSAAPRRPRVHRDPPGGALFPAVDLQPHDRGVRPPQRPRRPHPGARRRVSRLLRPAAGPADPVPS